ncbi:MAG: DUF5719 family protein [Actinomycetota bacterium]
MSDRVKELVFTLVLLVVVGMGVTFDALVNDVTPQAAADPPSGFFVERALFCPPAPEGTSASVEVVAGGMDEDPVKLGTEGEEAPDPVDNQIVVANPLTQPVDIVGYGGSVVAAQSETFEGPVEGTGAAPCSAEAGDKWFLPQGSSARGFNERIVLYNPFPSEAVVRVRFLTGKGERSPAALQEIPVASEGTTSIKVNDFILQQNVLGAEITAVRGRIAAWKVLFARAPDSPPGVGFSIGAREAAPEWFFPAGGVGADIDERISLMNPGDEEAIVTISLITDDGIVQPPAYVEFPIPRGSSRQLALRKQVGDLEGPVSVIVRSENDVPIVGERTVFYDGEGFHGFSSELGATSAANRWWLGPAVREPQRDSVIVMNVGDRDTTVSLRILFESGAPREPERLQGLKVTAGSRLRIDLQGLTDQPSAVLLTSDSPVVAERVAFSAASSDVSILLGIPLD